jgi:hypothetical protein
MVMHWINPGYALSRLCEVLSDKPPQGEQKQLVLAYVMSHSVSLGLTRRKQPHEQRRLRNLLVAAKDEHRTTVGNGRRRKQERETVSESRV